MTGVLALAGAVLAGGGCGQVASKAAIDHYVEGKMAMDSSEYDKALAELRQAVEIDPTLSLAHAAIGDIHRKRGDIALAAVSYEAACETNPYAFRPHYNLGVVYELLAAAAQTAQAVSEYIQKAVNVYVRAVTIKPEDFDANLNLSACYYRQGKFDLAEQYCQAAINIQPGSAAACSNLGLIYDAQNRPYDAIRAYKQALELDVHQPKVILNLGSTYQHLRRYREAITAFQLALKEDPACAEAYVHIAASHYHLKELDEALAGYQKAVDTDANSYQGFRGIGVVYITWFIFDRTRTEYRDKGLAAWNRSLEIQSNQPELLRLVRKYTPEAAEPPL